MQSPSEGLYQGISKLQVPIANYPCRTSYDSATQHHWLSIYRHKLLARFLLKDASKSPRNTHYRYVVSSQSEQEIRAAVERMIETLEAHSDFKGPRPGQQ